MPRMIFVNLPVADLEKSKRFFVSLGFSINEQFTDDTAACVVVSDVIFIMIMSRDKFQTFAPHPISDAHESTETLLCLSCDSREEVDNLVTVAEKNGGSRYNEPKDYGFMYQHGFQDPDGHVWELAYMEAGNA